MATLHSEASGPIQQRFLKLCVVTVLSLVFLLFPEHSSAENVIEVSVCDVLLNPPGFNRKLIKVSGVVTRGFEVFVVSDKRCSGHFKSLWLEFGGETASGSIYCCGVSSDTRRTKKLVVERISTSLLTDAQFEEFQRLTNTEKANQHVEASIVGRFFAGKEYSARGKQFWGGHGHMGMYSLFVVEQILDVKPLSR
jgi:hypothetical protein